VHANAQQQPEHQCTKSEVLATQQQRKKSFKGFYKPGTPLQNLNFGSFELYNFKSEISPILLL